MTGEHLGKAILCLSCDNFVITPKHYQDTIYKHVISVNHKCSKNLYPQDVYVDTRTGIPSVVDESCKEYKVR